MKAISHTHARNHLAEVTDGVCADRNPVLITRQGGPPVVVLCSDDYRSFEETAYLLRSPKNGASLAEAISEVPPPLLQPRDNRMHPAISNLWPTGCPTQGAPGPSLLPAPRQARLRPFRLLAPQQPAVRPDRSLSA